MNTQKDGFVTCSEVQAFFRMFNIPGETAARIFDHLDTDGTGLVDYQQFKKFFEQRINPKAKPAEVTPCSTRCPTRASSAACSRRPSNASECFTDPVVPTLSRWEMQRKLAQAVQMISDKANLRYPSFRELRQAFRWVDLSKDGKVTRAEVEEFFRVFSVPRETAEYLFVILNAKGCDEIDHSDFVGVFGPAMGIGHQEPSHKKQVELPGQRNFEKELNEILRVVADHMLKFSHPREAMRSLDLTHDGEITRNELRAFFARFGLEHGSADHVFELLVRNSGHTCEEHGTCSYEAFMQLFDPVMQPEHYAQGGCAQVF
jgi:Ca2+-binding EF-hand superfamily protein